MISAVSGGAGDPCRRRTMLTLTCGSAIACSRISFAPDRDSPHSHHAAGQRQRRTLRRRIRTWPPSIWVATHVVCRKWIVVRIFRQRGQRQSILRSFAKALIRGPSSPPSIGPVAQIFAHGLIWIRNDKPAIFWVATAETDGWHCPAPGARIATRVRHFQRKDLVNFLARLDFERAACKEESSPPAPSLSAKS